MKHFVLTAALALTVVTAGCRQADGPLPDVSTPDRMADLGDVGKDLMAIQSGDAGAPKDFVDDISRFAQNKDAEAATIELATRVAVAMKGAKALTMPDAMTLTTDLFQTVAGREISQAQAKALREDVKRLLAQAGAGDSAPVLEQMTALYKQVTVRPAKWYEFF